MSHDDWSDAADDAPAPDEQPDNLDHMWLTSVSGWSWDVDSLMMGEYVGYPLYLACRDRLATLDIPAAAHNRIIQELIDMHDVSAMTEGAARSTLICWDNGGEVVPMEIVSATEFPALTGC